MTITTKLRSDKMATNNTKSKIIKVDNTMYEALKDGKEMFGVTTFNEVIKKLILFYNDNSKEENIDDKILRKLNRLDDMLVLNQKVNNAYLVNIEDNVLNNETYKEEEHHYYRKARKKTQETKHINKINS